MYFRLFASHAWVLDELFPTKRTMGIRPHAMGVTLATRTWDHVRERWAVTGRGPQLKASENYTSDFGMAVVRS